MAQDKKRNNLILRVAKHFEGQGRTILALGNRTEQLIWLANEHGENVGLLHGKVSRHIREGQLKDYRVTYAAQKMATKALDKVTLDTLMILSLEPLLCKANNVQQSTGRIQRYHPDKKSILVVLFVDEKSGMLQKQLREFLSNAKFVLGSDVKIRRVDARELQEEWDA